MADSKCHYNTKEHVETMGSKINAMRSAHQLNQEFKRSGKAINCYLTDLLIREKPRDWHQEFKAS